MKRIWAAGFILVFLIILCGWGVYTTTSLTNQMAQTLDAAKEAAENGNQADAVRLSDEASQTWIKDHEILCTFISHTRLETIDQTLAGLTPLITHGTVDQFSAECSRGIRQVKSLNESELPTIGNIL